MCGSEFELFYLNKRRTNGRIAGFVDHVSSGHFNLQGGRSPAVYIFDMGQKRFVFFKLIDQEWPDSNPSSLIQSRHILKRLQLSSSGDGSPVGRFRLFPSGYGKVVSVPGLLSQLRDLLLIKANQFIGLSPRTLHLFKLAAHDGELSVINPECSESDQSKSDLTPQRGVVNPVNIFRKFCGICWLLMGIIMASLSHYALLYRGWDWLGWRRVIEFPVGGWLVVSSGMAHPSC